MNNLRHYTKNYAAKHRKKARWAKVLMGLTVVVAFCTVYALIFPAVTQKTDIHFGIEEHEGHCLECYEKVLACMLKEAEDHRHAESFYAQNAVLSGFSL